MSWSRKRHVGTLSISLTHPVDLGTRSDRGQLERGCKPIQSVRVHRRGGPLFALCMQVGKRCSADAIARLRTRNGWNGPPRFANSNRQSIDQSFCCFRPFFFLCVDHDNCLGPEQLVRGMISIDQSTTCALAGKRRVCVSLQGYGHTHDARAARVDARAGRPA